MAETQRKLKPAKIAAAVNGYCKALRLLGRTQTSVGQIAATLWLTDDEVIAAFKDYRIAGAKIDPRVRTSITHTETSFTPTINLKPRDK